MRKQIQKSSPRTDSCTSQRDPHRTNDCQIQGTVELNRGTISRKLQYSCIPRARHLPNKWVPDTKGSRISFQIPSKSRQHVQIVWNSSRKPQTPTHAHVFTVESTESCTPQARRRTGTDRQGARRMMSRFLSASSEGGTRGFRYFPLPPLLPLPPRRRKEARRQELGKVEFELRMRELDWVDADDQLTPTDSHAWRRWDGHLLLRIVGRLDQPSCSSRKNLLWLLWLLWTRPLNKVFMSTSSKR